MICGNCGFQNEPGDEFCGSCGQFLAWTGTSGEGESGSAAPADAGPTSGDVDAASGADGGPVGEPAPGPGGAPDATPTTVSSTPPAVGATTVTPPPPGTSRSAQLQRCAVCGTANELTRTFCLNCGAKLSKSGTTTRLATKAAAGRGGTRPHSRVLPYFAAILLVGLIVVFGGIVVLVGLPGGPAVQPSNSAGPSLPVALVTPAASTFGAPPPSGAPPVSGASPSNAPGLTPPPSGPADTAQPIGSTPPSAPASAPPSSSTGLSCSDQQFGATAPGGWTITGARWGRHGSTDYLAVAVKPGGSTSATASVDAYLVPPGDVQSRFGVAPPATGDVALVLAFNDAVTLSGPFGSQVDYKALKEFQATHKGRMAFVVIGVAGAGCFDLQSSGWASGANAPTEVEVDIAR